MQVKRNFDALKQIAEELRLPPECIVLKAFFDSEYNKAIDILSNPRLPQPTAEEIAWAKNLIKTENSFANHSNPKALYFTCAHFLGLPHQAFREAKPEGMTLLPASTYPETLAAITANQKLLTRLEYPEEGDVDHFNKVFALGGAPKPGEPQSKGPDLTVFALLSGDLIFFQNFVRFVRANPQMKDLIDLNTRYTPKGFNLMHLAARQKAPGLVSYLIQEGVPYDLRTIPASDKEPGFTPLQLAMDSPAIVEEFFNALTLLGDDLLLKALNNVTNEPSNSSQQSTDLLSYYLRTTRAAPPAKEKSTFIADIFLRYLEISYACIDLVDHSTLETLINETPELENSYKQYAIVLLKTKNKDRANEARVAAEAANTSSVLPPSPPRPPAEAALQVPAKKAAVTAPLKPAPKPPIANNNSALMLDETLQHTAASSSTVLPNETSTATVANTSTDEAPPKKAVNSSAAMLDETLPPTVADTSTDEAPPNKAVNSSAAMLDETLPPTIADTSTDEAHHVKKAAAKAAAPQLPPRTRTRPSSSDPASGKKGKKEAGSDKAKKQQRNSLEQALDHTAALVAEPSSGTAPAQPPEPKHSLQWKLALVATALLKDQKKVSADSEIDLWAQKFKFIVENAPSRAQRLLSRLEEIAEEDPKPEITLYHLSILAGNPLDIIAFPKQETITEGVEVSKIETVDSYRYPLVEGKPHPPEFKRLQLTAIDKSKTFVYAYEYVETVQNGKRTVSFIPCSTVADALKKDPNFLKKTLIESKDGRTILHWAAIGGSYAIMENLLEGLKALSKTAHNRVLVPNLNTPDRLGNTVAHEAASAGSYNIEVQKIERLYLLGGRNYSMQVDWPVETTDASLQLYTLLAQNQADFFTGNHQGESAMLRAILSGQLDFLDHLAKRPNASVLDIHRDGTRISILHYAAMLTNSITILRRVATAYEKEGVHLECEDAQGFRPLHYATAIGNLPAVVILLSLGANPFQKNNPVKADADTPLTLALSTEAIGYYDTDAKAMQVQMCQRIKGMVSFLARYRSVRHFVRDIGLTNLYAMSHLLLNQAHAEHNKLIIEANERIVDEEYKQYQSSCQDVLQLNKQMSKNDFKQKFKADLDRLKKPLLTMAQYKDLCLEQGCAELKLSREQYNNLLPACLPLPQERTAKFIERGIREYVLALMTVYLLRGVTPRVEAVEDACFAARKKYALVQRRLELTVKGPSKTTLTEKVHDNLRLKYLGKHRADPIDKDKEIRDIEIDFEDAKKALKKLLQEYIAPGSQQLWVTVNKIIDNTDVAVPVKDKSGQRIRHRGMLSFFSSTKTYESIAEKCLNFIEDNLTSDGKPLNKETLLSFIEKTYTEAQELFMQDRKLSYTDATDLFFDILLTALYMTEKAPEHVRGLDMTMEDEPSSVPDLFQ